jgi:hypothetical protein
MNDCHISDDRLVDICLNAATAAERAHLAICPRCEERRVDIVGILAELDDAATQDAGVAFSDERLEKQHASILQRVESDGRPGRLVAFPAPPAGATVMTTRRPRMSWAAAVAAAAFIAGVFTGQWTHIFTETDLAPSHVVANETDPTPLLPVPTTFSEDEFLGQVELAASRNGPVALRPLDSITPRAWEVI